MPGTIHLGLIRASSHKYLKYLNAGEIAGKRVDEDMKARLEGNKTVPTHCKISDKRESKSVTPKSQEGMQVP